MIFFSWLFCPLWRCFFLPRRFLKSSFSRRKRRIFSTHEEKLDPSVLSQMFNINTSEERSWVLLCSVLVSSPSHPSLSRSSLSFLYLFSPSHPHRSFHLPVSFFPPFLSSLLVSFPLSSCLFPPSHVSPPLLSPRLPASSSIMHHHCLLVIGALLSLAVPLLVAMETCPATGMPGMPGLYLCVHAVHVVYLLLLLLFVYTSLHPQVSLGCPAKTVVTERKERKDAQVSDTHVDQSCWGSETPYWSIQRLFGHKPNCPAVVFMEIIKSVEFAQCALSVCPYCPLLKTFQNGLILLLRFIFTWIKCSTRTKHPVWFQLLFFTHCLISRFPLYHQLFNKEGKAA